MRIIALAAALMAPSVAYAFCGTYVGQPGSDLYSGSSQVVLARTGTSTALTLTSDYDGDLAEFALVIPVPPGVTKDDVEVVDRSVVDRVATYSAPRLVSYECSDLYFRPSRGCSGFGCQEMALTSQADSNAAFEGEQALDVTVEEQFVAGEYEIVVLSSDTEADLVQWLQEQGYGVSDDAIDLFGDYIEDGAQFFAAKVKLDDTPRLAGAYLSPLQVRYESETLGLPIRLGTLNSPGVQDLIVYGLTDSSVGTLSVANYPQATIEGECMVRSEPEDFGAFYGDRLDEAFEDMPAAWALEYSWSSMGCDPCPPGGALEEEDIRALGFEGSNGHAHFTRLHLRYEADAVTEDLVLYGDAEVWGGQQMRYIQHKEELEGTFAVCGEGFIADPDLCKHQKDAVTGSLPPWALGWGFGGLLLSLGVVFRRRRS